jgi:hypothetical protein
MTHPTLLAHTYDAHIPLPSGRRAFRTACPGGILIMEIGTTGPDGHQLT